MTNNLLLRGRFYSVRLFVPADMKEHVGKAEIVKSLRTRDKSQAKLLLRRIQHVVDRLFFCARIGMIHKGKLTALLQGYIEDALTDWSKNKDRLKSCRFDLSETMGELYLSGAEESIAEQFKVIAAGIREDYFVNGRKEFVQGLAKVILENNGLTLDPESPDFVTFCDQFAKVNVWAQEELANREEGNFSYDYREKVAGMIAEELPVTLKEAADEWLEQKEVKGLTNGTMANYREIVGIVLRFYEEDYPVRRLNNRELLRYVKNEQGRGIKDTTVEKRLRVIKEVVTLASANHGFPPHTYKIELKNDASDVKPYTADELNQIFQLLSTKRDVTEWQYWATLIGLFGGLRREEVVSLRVKDIRQDNGVWYFDIRESKSDAGIRYVPISGILGNLGFFDFLKARRGTGEERLLMGWYQAPKSEYAAITPTKYGDFFRNLMKGVQVNTGPNEKKDLHSLRHNFSNSLKQSGVRPDITDELCGHEHAPGSMRSIYDEKFGLSILAENLGSAVWECDFSLLKTWKG